MAIEIEKKYRLSARQYAQLSSVLEEIGAQLKGEDFEENTLYRGGVLDEKNAVLRVRKIAGKTILTYKRRIQNELDVKRQIEYETEIADAEEIENIIENLGFVRSVVYEKRRHTWNFREVEIVLDELPFGLFMEIEGSITAIREAEMFLGAEDFTVEHETYPRLTAKYGKKNGALIEARFEE
ncbi:MAG TPA: class IV adenylate cyclase [Pyrinomonadaceae bacterium]|jgi:adenylate cyclase class 2